jgi:hypothetical protein
MMSQMISRQAKGRAAEELRCSFCNQSQADVGKLIAGPTVFICDECVSICQEIIAEDLRNKAGDEAEPIPPLPKSSVVGSPVKCALCGTLTPPSDVVPIRDRGVLCVGCVGEVEAAVAERRGPQVQREPDW